MFICTDKVILIIIVHMPRQQQHSKCLASKHEETSSDETTQNMSGYTHQWSQWCVKAPLYGRYNVMLPGLVIMKAVNIFHTGLLERQLLHALICIHLHDRPSVKARNLNCLLYHGYLHMCGIPITTLSTTQTLHNYQKPYNCRDTCTGFLQNFLGRMLISRQ